MLRRQFSYSPLGWLLYRVALLIVLVVVVVISPSAQFCLAFSSPPSVLRRPHAARTNIVERVFAPSSPPTPAAQTLMLFSSTKKAASDPPLDSSSATASSAASSLSPSMDNRTSAVAPLSMAAADVSAMEYPPNGEPSAASSNSNIKTPPFPVVVWRFTRPHTLIGSALAIPALHLLAAPTLRAALSLQCLYSILYATIPALLMNLYITGLNQVTDVEIDKINKPDLPIACGILSPRRAIAICISALVGSLAFGLAAVGGSRYATPGLNVALWGSGLLGTLYSLPPVRLKRFPLLAAFCIVSVRGTIINASFFAHATQAAFSSSAGRSTAATSVLSCLAQDPRCFWSSLFFGVFGLVIAIMKDVPDVLGDKISDIRTFSVRVGPLRIFGAARRILTALLASTSAAFVRLAVTAASSNNPLLVGRRLVTAACAAWAAVSVRQHSGAVDPEDPGQVYSYYMHLWKIFYLCYLVLPLAR